jgi:hypothetical protein
MDKFFNYFWYVIIIVYIINDFCVEVIGTNDDGTLTKRMTKVARGILTIPVVLYLITNIIVAGTIRQSPSELIDAIFIISIVYIASSNIKGMINALKSDINPKWLFFYVLGFGPIRSAISKLF